MKKLKTGIEILKYLSGQNKPISVEDITNYLNTSFELEKDLKPRSIKEYLRELSNELIYTNGGTQAPIIESRRGIDGGWMLTASGREEMKRLSFNSFNSDTLNAINDSFQRAMVSETFYYKNDLKKARSILYATKNFHEADHEHYLGNGSEIIKSTIIKKLKQVALENKYARITFKHIRYSVTEKVMDLKVIRLIHDLDESFVVCSKEGSFEPMYINIRNVAAIKILNKSFPRKYEAKFKNTINDDKSSIKVRTEQWARIKVINPFMYEVIDLWTHGCTFEYSEDRSIITIRSSEHYRLMIFLFRTIGCAKILDAHKMVKERWNRKVNLIQPIE
ncbi:hypothetical protein [Mycoplasma todarodis]|uniref:Uncharacterized protein n=1 Tax=Mycoplasma todarodis TaxID=1937191 RepID=A0A4R0XNG5_9MOLU|nr:hypothetical protein [Mycoplasma todarodis]TCG12112.1 hypothetical protein C4B25_00255 [Mycoplasma todarodis]